MATKLHFTEAINRLAQKDPEAMACLRDILFTITDGPIPETGWPISRENEAAFRVGSASALVGFMGAALAKEGR